MKYRIKVLSGNAGAPLAKEICDHLSIEPTKALVSRFNDGEVQVQIQEEVRGADLFIVNPIHSPAENLLEMVFLADAARRSSAGRITLVIPYLGYNRKDWKDEPRVPLSACIVIRILAHCGANRALLFDVHSEATVDDFDPLVVDHLYASAISVGYLKQLLPRPFVVASPDRGGGRRANAYARRLGQSDFVLFNKDREKPGVVKSGSIKIIGEVKGRDVLFVDDMVDTGGTLVEDAKAARAAGARRIFAFATHGIFSNDAIARLDRSPIQEVIVTDTIAHTAAELKTKRLKITVLPMASFIAKAIRRTHDEESLSALIE